jgi:hypothetical protein
MALPVSPHRDPLPGRGLSQALVAPSVHASVLASIHAPAQQAGRLALRSDPTELHRHRAHCAAARHQLHALQSLFEALDAFLSPRFFSMLAVLGVAAWLVFWLSA